jgi:hypothetical protein
LPVFAATILSWDPPTTKTDGTPIAPGDILGYAVSRSDTLEGPKTSLGETTSTTFPLNDADYGKWLHVSTVSTGGTGQPASLAWLAPGPPLNTRIEGTFTGTLIIQP